MKKMMSMVLLLLFILCMTACGENQEVSMQLKVADLTEQENGIVKLLQNDNFSEFFDYTVGENIKSMSVKCYKLDDNGTWIHETGGNHVIENKAGRIAIEFNHLGEGFHVAIQNGDTISGVEHHTNQKINTEGMANSTFFASTENFSMETIECGKEIPVVIQIFTSKDEISSYGVTYFNEPQVYQEQGYEFVYAVTIEFSEKELS